MKMAMRYLLGVRKFLRCDDPSPSWLLIDHPI